MRTEKFKLKTIANVGAGNSAPNKDDFSDYGIPFIRAGSLAFLTMGESIDKCEKIDTNLASKKNLKLFPKSSILFAKSGMSAKMGRVYELPKDAYVVSHLAVIQPNADKVNPSYLKYFLLYRPPFHLIKDDAYPSIKISDIEELEIDIPEIETQNKIVAILDKVNSLIAKRDESILCLNQLVKSTFFEMFGNVVSFDKTDSSIPLGTYISIKHGFAFKSEYFDEAGKYVLLTPGNFHESGGYRERGEKQNFYVGHIPDGYILKKDDLLVAMTEQAPGLLGSPLFIPENDTFLHNQRLGLIQIKDKKVEKTFLFYLFNTGLMRSIIHARAVGVKVRHTSPTKIEAIEITLPELIQQKKFVSYAKHIENSLIMAELSKSQINILFKSILQKVFNGQLNFNVDFELDALVKEIDLLKKENDLSKITDDISYLQRLVDKLNNQEFKEKDLYDKAKHGVFQLLVVKDEERKVIQKYDENSKSLKLALK